MYFGIGEFRPQTDQRSDDSNLQHVKGETGRNCIKRYMYHDYIGNFQHFSISSFFFNVSLSLDQAFFLLLIKVCVCAHVRASVCVCRCLFILALLLLYFFIMVYISFHNHMPSVSLAVSVSESDAISIKHWLMIFLCRDLL